MPQQKLDDDMNDTADNTKPSLANWRLAPHSKWAFQHVNQLIPAATINASSFHSEFTEKLHGNLDNEFIDSDSRQTVSQHLHNTFSDNLLILQKGNIVYRWHAEHSRPQNPHILFSISKSITAMVAGILQHQGLLDTNKAVGFYLPGCHGSAYQDCSLQNLLDMAAALDFDETYLDPDSDFRRYRDATGWNPVDQNNPGPDLENFLYSIKKASRNHGEIFAYKSPNSDLLGLLLERVAGIPYAELVSQLLWQPMAASRDAYVTVDRSLLARGAGGICATIDDLARVGQLILDRGAVGTRQVIPEQWIDDTANNGDSIAWSKGDFSELAPKGNYRNKWYLMGNSDQVSMAIGIHGQWLYINPKKQIVIAKQASQPLPLDDDLDAQSLRFFRQVCQLISD
ncbi:MAG: CubicO group peptidase (beta-lactamase class C family) [Planctomycetota bacterium]|jgi:CubicO group peptidase (beta-lactamase class C family)